MLMWRMQELEKLIRSVGLLEIESAKFYIDFNLKKIVWLLRYFLDHYEESRGALTNEQEIKIFLRYVGDPGFQSGVAENLGVHQTTISKVIVFIATKIVKKFPCGSSFQAPKRKLKQQTPTVNVQATCNSRELITSVEVSWPGSLHDARIRRNSGT
jgi:hypothetical protein